MLAATVHYKVLISLLYAFHIDTVREIT